MVLQIGNKIWKLRKRSYKSKNNPMYGKVSAMKGKNHSNKSKDIMKIKRKLWYKNNPKFNREEWTKYFQNKIGDLKL